ncbi:MAG: helix-turn-helix domain-containing protein, partial [Oscillospiraceae bacterium]|nr:helix-turn-helix domain-containing protein [Oscillospiraceae bacterium]
MIHIAENLRRLRRERGLTQEELASKLGVSPQAISKWENDSGYPDVTFLPTLATYFGTTIDALVGMDKLRLEAYREDTMIRAAKCDSASDKLGAIEVWRERVKTIPDDYGVMCDLAFRLASYEADEATELAFAREAAGLCERLNDSPYSGLRLGRENIVLAYCYNRLGQPELAQRVVQPGAVDSFEMNYPYLVRGAERTAIGDARFFSGKKASKKAIVATYTSREYGQSCVRTPAKYCQLSSAFLQLFREKARILASLRHSYRPDAASDTARLFANLLLAFGEREE